MLFLRSNFARYRWWLLLLAGIGGALAGNNVLNALPPGTDLVGALIALYALARNEREAGSTAVADKVSERIWQRLGAIDAQLDRTEARADALARVAHDHADKLIHLGQWATRAHGYVAPETAVMRP